MKDLVTQAIKFLQCGKIISFPTETVYALACDPGNEEAISGIYSLKERAPEKALALLVASKEQAMEVAEFAPKAHELADKYWPGALTMVLPRKENSILAANFNPEYQNIAVRMPDHTLALEILRKYGKPIVGTSANISGESSATSYEEVRKSFSDKIEMIIDGGASEIGIASTIILVDGDECKILRQGSLILENLLN